MADELQPNQDNNQQPANDGGGYGKRPMWQWILIYLVIGAIVYFAIYYFVFADNGNGTDDATNNTEQTEQEDGGGLFNY